MTATVWYAYLYTTVGCPESRDKMKKTIPLGPEPVTERPVFGKIRYMNAAGLKRKFDPDEYVKKVNRIEKGQL